MSKTSDIVILGQGGLSKEIKFLISDINQKEKKWNFLGFVGQDDSQKEFFGNDEFLLNYKNKLAVAIGIGTPSTNYKIIQKLKNQKNLTFPNLIHPTVVKSDKVKFGEGNIVCANNIFTVDIVIGNFNIFNLNSTYGHDLKIGSFNIFNPGVNCSGGVEIEHKNLIGTNAAILQYLKIGSNNSIGAGAVVTKNFDDSNTIVGVPAKKIN